MIVGVCYGWSGFRDVFREGVRVGRERWSDDKGRSGGFVVVCVLDRGLGL